ncbi:TerC family protein [Paenibacillus humicola]|uniref:TerC family protein n=1 Tax=Paenibacillus humicola TaxID=3110540 RepID=UPI0030845FFE
MGKTSRLRQGTRFHLLRLKAFAKRASSFAGRSGVSKQMELFLLLLEIILVNLVLSGDNAVVIAMACRNLPIETRQKAVWWGALGAVILRIILTVVALYLLQIPFIQIIGAALLFFVAVQLLKDDGESKQIEGAASLWKAIRIILTADFIMSLDNVLAVASIAKNNIWIIAAGIAISIPLIVWGSQLIMKLLNRFPVLVYVGAGILGYTGGEMLEESERLLNGLQAIAGGWAEYAFPVVCGVAVIVTGYLLQKRAHRHVAQE